jgi:hypothetical protein
MEEQPDSNLADSQQLPGAPTSATPKPTSPSPASLEKIKRAGHRDIMSVLEAWGVKHSVSLLVEAAQEMKKGFFLFGILLVVIGVYEWHLVSFYDTATYQSLESKSSDQNDSNLKLLNNQIATEQGARIEAEGQRDHFEELYHDDENTMVPLREAAQAKFATAPPDKRLDLLLQKMDTLQNDIETKVTVTTVSNNSAIQLLAMATVDLSVSVAANKTLTPGNSHNIGAVTQAGLGKGITPLLIASTQECDSQIGADGSGTVTAMFPASLKSLYMGQPISNLKEAEYIQIDCTIIPPNSQIGG